MINRRRTKEEEKLELVQVKWVKKIYGLLVTEHKYVLHKMTCTTTIKGTMGGGDGWHATVASNCCIIINFRCIKITDRELS